MTTRSPSRAQLEVLLEGDEGIGNLLRAVRERPAFLGVRVVLAGRLQRNRPDREAGVQQGGEPGQPVGEVAVRVLRLRVVVRLAVVADEPAELAAKLVGLSGRLGSPWSGTDRSRP